MASTPETTFINGKIFTGRSEQDFVSGFSVRDGKISGIGDVGGATKNGSIDLRGRTVVPGFLDIHTHPTYVAMTVNAVPCTVPAVKDIPEMIAALKRHPNFGKGPNEWIEGWGYDESKLAEHRTPTAEDLDKVSTEQPVYVLRSDAHSGICNTRALAIAGITKETPDPPHARFGRYANGEPNGVLQEHAANDAVMKFKSVQDFNGKVSGIAATGAHYNERGIVAVSDMMVFTSPYDDLQVYRSAAELGLRQQVPLYFDWSATKQNPIPDLTDEQRTGRIKFAGIKLFGDGSISNRTAWVTAPYRNSTDHGFATLTDADMEAAYQWAKRNRVQIAFHMMGDKTIQRAVDFYAGKEPWMGKDIPSIRMEHVTLLTDAQIRRMSRGPMTFGASMQIIFLFAEFDSYSANLDDDQLKQAYRVKALYDGVERAGLSSDAPATTWDDPDNVFVSIKAAVTRKAYNGADICQDQAITVPQAVLLYTARAARVAPYEGLLGKIDEGYEASFVVLDKDIFTIDVDDIDTTTVHQTWIQGEKVFERA